MHEYFSILLSSHDIDFAKFNEMRIKEHNLMFIQYICGANFHTHEPPQYSLYFNPTETG